METGRIKRTLVPSPPYLDIKENPTNRIKKSQAISCLRCLVLSDQKVILKIQDVVHYVSMPGGNGHITVRSTVAPFCKVNEPQEYLFGFLVRNSQLTECFAVITPSGSQWTIDDNDVEIGPMVEMGMSEKDGNAVKLIRAIYDWSKPEKAEVIVIPFYRICGDISESRKPHVFGKYNKGVSPMGLEFPKELLENNSCDFVSFEYAKEVAAKLQVYLDSFRVSKEEAERLKKEKFKELMKKDDLPPWNEEKKQGHLALAAQLTEKKPAAKKIVFKSKPAT